MWHGWGPRVVEKQSMKSIRDKAVFVGYWSSIVRHQVPVLFRQRDEMRE